VLVVAVDTQSLAKLVPPVTDALTVKGPLVLSWVGSLDGMLLLSGGVQAFVSREHVERLLMATRDGHRLDPTDFANPMQA
jgi:hypothetical protein